MSTSSDTSIEHTVAPRRSAARAAVGQYVEPEDDIAMESGDGSDDDDDSDDSSEKWDDLCHACQEVRESSELLCCSYRAGSFQCPRVYHLSCLDPPLKRAPKGDWFCPECEDKLQYEEVEKFLSMRTTSSSEGSTSSSPPKRQLYCKMENASYLHCEWVDEAVIVELSERSPGLKSRYRNFLAKVDAKGGLDALEEEDEELGREHGVDPQWLQPERVISAEAEPDGSMTYLFKWKGLDYDQCTWETEDDIDEYGLNAEVDAFKSLRSIQEQAAELKAAARAASKRTGKGAAPVDARTHETTPEFLAGGVLHSYQLDGLNWLLLRCRRKENMILADEMGLGKTVQTISFLASLREMGDPKPHIVIVPLSTLPNWERELAKWAPQLYVVSLKGNATARQTIRKYDWYVDEAARKARTKGDRNDGLRFHVLLCTYETVQQDIGSLKSLNWSTMTVDEGHRLKSAKSKLFALLSEMNVDHRLLLTGTPLQNNLDELFFLMSFIEPERFSSLTEFQQNFASITRQEQVGTLHDLLEKHILRRVKKDVLKQLPPKREQIVRVELSSQQKEFYKQILVKQYPALASRGGGGQATMLKNVMMELRKCCNHPYLFEGSEDLNAPPDQALENLVKASGKLELLDRMMPAFKRDGHRVLIYSQFARTLDILETWLVARGWGFQRIDGSVRGPDRQIRIDKFNNDREMYWVFLLSTRAGGLGINLATADTVVIFDSDWNPHNDIQAQARAHRLGQQRPVFTYRLVTRGTVEERMMQRAKEKRMLESVVMGRPDLKQSDLDDILRYGAQELFAEDDDADSSGDEGTDGGAAAGGDAAAAPTSAADEQQPPVKKSEEGKDKPEGSAVAHAAAAAEPAEAPCAKPDGGKGGDAATPNGDAAQAEQAPAQHGAAAPERALCQKENGGREKGGPVGKDEPAARAAKPKRAKRSRRIVYDDDALQRLLDRVNTEAEEVEEKDSDFMAAFKVANFALTEEEQAAQADAEQVAPKPEPALAGNHFWQSLLQAHHVNLQEQELAMLGRGRRNRAQVSYFEGDDGAQRTNLKRKRSESGPAASDDWEPEGSPEESLDEECEDEGLPSAPLPYSSDPPASATFTVHGLTQRARKEFVRALMVFGLRLDGDMRTDWGHFVRCTRSLAPTVFSGNSDEEMRSYGRLLVRIVYDCCRASSAHATNPKEIVLPSTTRLAPLDIFLDKYKPLAVLARAGLLHALHAKLREFAASSRPPHEFSVNHGANRSRNSIDFYVIGVHGSELSKLIQTSAVTQKQYVEPPRVSAADVSAWTPAHDLALCKGILKHGAERSWRHIAEDSDLSIGSAARKLLGIPTAAAAGPRSAAASAATSSAGNAANDAAARLGPARTGSGDSASAAHGRTANVAAGAVTSGQTDAVAGSSAAPQPTARPGVDESAAMDVDGDVRDSDTAVHGQCRVAHAAERRISAGSGSAAGGPEPASKNGQNSGTPRVNGAGGAAAPDAGEASARDASGAAAKETEDAAAEAGGAAGSGQGDGNEQALNPAEVAKFKMQETAWLRARFDWLSHELATELATRPPADLKYAGGQSFPTPLVNLLQSLPESVKTHLMQLRSRLMHAHEAVSSHTREAAQSTAAAFGSNAAERFRALVIDYNTRVRELHQGMMATLKYMTAVTGGDVPPECKLPTRPLSAGRQAVRTQHATAAFHTSTPANQMHIRRQLEAHQAALRLMQQQQHAAATSGQAQGRPSAVLQGRPQTAHLVSQTTERLAPLGAQQMPAGVVQSTSAEVHIVE